MTDFVDDLEAELLDGRAPRATDAGGVRSRAGRAVGPLPASSSPPLAVVRLRRSARVRRPSARAHRGARAG